MEISNTITAIILAAAISLSTAVHEAITDRIAEIYEEEVTAVEEMYGDDARMLAKLIWGEARGLSKTEQAAVVWCVLNRVDANFADSISGVITAKGQFTGYRSSNPVTTEHYELAMDVLFRWYREQKGYENVGRVLPKEYCFFAGDGKHNYFRPTYSSTVRWDWSLPSPYEG